MAALISSQLDFIFFFYGLAFILLGTTAFAIGRGRGNLEPWAMLGTFGFVHGAGEWLDLTALILGDMLPFAIFRTVLMAVSFLFLMEFARQDAVLVGWRPARYLRTLYPFLLGLPLACGLYYGLPTAMGIARYTIGFPAATAVAFAFGWHASKFNGPERHLSICAAIAFALYAVAAGVIVPPAGFWPANTINTEWFTAQTGLPIQLIRGTLACMIALSIWWIWGEQLIVKVASTDYAVYLRRQFVWTLIAMGVILSVGWVLTDYLGDIQRKNVQTEAQSDMDLLASRLKGETALPRGIVTVLAGSSMLRPLLTGGTTVERSDAQSLLDLHAKAAGDAVAMVFDRSGDIVAASNSIALALDVPNESAEPFFMAALAGQPGFAFVYAPARQLGVYFVSQPIRDEIGTIIGVAVLKVSLNRFVADLHQFDHPYFLVDRDGIIVLTNNPKRLLRPFWPIDASERSAVEARYGGLDPKPMLKSEVKDSAWVLIDGDRDYVLRRFLDDSGWSLITLMPTREVFASRVLGIVITFLVTIMALIFLFGRERGVRDRVEMDRRLKLQELTRDLRFQATTDPLTGLANRLKLDQVLAAEIERAERYATPLAIVLYDVDHFKDVNDSYGHQAGDNVLIELSRFASAHTRGTDLLARWGGEEFVFLLPGADGEMAYQAAEKLRSDISLLRFAEVGRVTCSFGIAEYVSGDSSDSLIARADGALYRAKVSGRNCVELAAQPAAQAGLASSGAAITGF